LTRLVNNPHTRNRLPTLQALQALDAAARHGSYSAAAAELGVTHGAISHRIRELEHTVGFRLFRRTGRAMRPTRDALSVLAVTRQALALLGDAFPPAGAQDSGRLVVGVHPALASRWLVPRLGGFRREHGPVSLEVRSTAELGDFLGTGVDIAIRYGSGDWPEVHAQQVGRETLLAVCSPGYARRMRLERAADLERCTLLRHSWQSWRPWLEAAGLELPEPDGGLLVSDSAMLTAAALSDQGVALLGRCYVTDALAAGTLTQVGEVEVDDVHAYYVIWRSGTRPGRTARRFVDWLGGCLADNETRHTAPDRAAGAGEPQHRKEAQAWRR